MKIYIKIRVIFNLIIFEHSQNSSEQNCPFVKKILDVVKMIILLKMSHFPYFCPLYTIYISTILRTN